METSLRRRELARQASMAKSREIRENILAAASALYVQGGTHNVTMRALAKKLGVSTMTAYHYFRGKDEMMAALQARALNRFSDAIEKADSGSDHPCERYMLRRDAYVNFALEDFVAYRLIFEYVHPNHSAHPELRRAIRRARFLLARNFNALVDQGYLRGDSAFLGHLSWGIMHGVMTLQIGSRISPAIKPQALLDAAREGLLLQFATKKWWRWAAEQRTRKNNS